MDRYDGIVIGDLVTEFFMNNGTVNSSAIGKEYDLKLRVDLNALSPNVKNIGVEDTSRVYEIVQTYSQSMLEQLTDHICLYNTTQTPLGANGVFEGAYQDTFNYAEIIVSLSTDKNSATDGLQICWSADGITCNETDLFSILANKAKTFTFPCNRRYVKLSYTNGTEAQGVLNIATYFKVRASKGSSHRINDKIVGEDDASLVKSVLTGLDDYNEFQNITSSKSGRLNTLAQPYGYAVAEGDLLGHTSLLKFGTRGAVLANTQSIVWEGTNALYTYLTSAEILKVSSSSVNDVATTGTGARTLTIVGLDGSYNEITETINMNGTNVVSTTKTFLRVFRAYVETCGSSLTNVGTITITNNAGTNQLLVINALDGQTLMAIWTVPAGKTLYLTSMSASTDSSKGSRVSLFTKQLNGGTLYPYRIRYRAYIFQGNEIFPFDMPFKIPEKTDIEIRVITDANAGTTRIGATFEGWYETND